MINQVDRVVRWFTDRQTELDGTAIRRHYDQALCGLQKVITSHSDFYSLDAEK